jgi:hypothetical protein
MPKASGNLLGGNAQLRGLPAERLGQHLLVLGVGRGGRLEARLPISQVARMPEQPLSLRDKVIAFTPAQRRAERAWVREGLRSAAQPRPTAQGSVYELTTCCVW